MFTGIVTHVGRVARIERRGDTRFIVESGLPLDEIAIGASVSHAGCCLTVVGKGAGWHAVDVSAESIARTTLGDWTVGTEVNLERPLRLGDELGGHILSGHVDGVAIIRDRRPEGDSVRYVLEAPEALARFIAPKGSVALDGVSLTVNEVDSANFGINLIPHTQACTTFRTLQPGQRLNLEIDLLARYVARLLERPG